MKTVSKFGHSDVWQSCFTPPTMSCHAAAIFAWSSTVLFKTLIAFVTFGFWYLHQFASPPGVAVTPDAAPERCCDDDVMDVDDTHQFAGPVPPPGAPELADRAAASQLVKIYALGI